MVVSGAALAWVGVLLWRTWPVFREGLGQVDRPMMLAGFALVAVASLLVFEAFRPLARVSGITGLSPLQLGHLHFTSQLLRHLPGRIWGIGYQIAGGRPGGSVGAWLVVNVLHMGLAIYFALLTSALVLLVPGDVPLAVLAGAAGLALYAVGWRLARATWLTRKVAPMRGRTGAALRVVVGSAARARTQDAGHAALAFVASWIAMYGAWLCFAAAYPALQPAEGARLLALYMIAWFVGYATVVSPSGLGVRELVFAALAHDAGADVVAYLAIAGRVSLLSGDLVLGLLFAPFVPTKSQRSG
ncbi:MAG: hypothetical protein KF823_07270 [Xanthomonadales bacterium]|nr:hypothetical protein [Xanthomonadales bacterium]